MNRKEKPAVLYVDDEEENLSNFRHLYRRDYDVHLAQSAEEGRLLMEQHDIPLVIADQRMPGTTGVEFLEQVMAGYPESIRILLTGYSDIDAVIEAINGAKVHRYLSKPYDAEELKQEIENGLERYRMRQENVRLTADLSSVNEELQEALEKVRESEQELAQRVEARTAKLAQSERRFRRLLEAAPDSILLVTGNGEIAFVNEMSEQLFGYTRDELVGEKLELLIPTEWRGDHVKLREGFMGEEAGDRVMAGGRDLIAVRKDGAEIPVEISLSRQESDDGSLVVAAVRDISERKQRETMVLAMQKMRQSIWRLDSRSQVQDILTALQQVLTDIDVSRMVCGVNIVDESENEPRATFYNLVDGQAWNTGEIEPEGARVVAEFHRAGKTVYRPDLFADDSRGERGRGKTKTRSPRRAIVDVPFSHGTLAFNSDKAHAFDDHLPVIEEIAEVLSEAFRRLDDLDALRERTATAVAAQTRVEAEMAERRREERLREAVQLVRDAMWNLTSPDAEDERGILLAVREALGVAGLPFHNCGVNVVEEEDGETTVRVHEMTREGSWVRHDLMDPAIQLVIEFWRKGEPIYRADIEADDHYNEWQSRRRGDRARTILDVPFSHGTLAVNSLEPDAFGTAEIEVVKRLAEVLSEAFRRLDDLDALRERTATAEAAQTRVEAEMAERRKRGHRERARQRMSQAIWELDSLSDVSHLLIPLHQVLGELDLSYRESGINLVDASTDPPDVYSYNLEEGKLVRKKMSPSLAPDVVSFWQQQKVAYRRDILDREYGITEGQIEAGIRSIVDLPFSHGTLAFNSREVDAFGDHVDALEELAATLSEGFLRLEDLQALRERTVTAEAAQREASLLHRSSEAAADTDSFDSVLQSCIDMVCELTGWPIGHAYVPDREAGVLQSTSIWHLTRDEKHEEFRTVTEQTPFASGVGLPGRIWASGEPAWVVNVQQDPNFPRNQLCRALSVKGAFGFPVLIDGHTVAVLEFFSEQEMVEEPALLRTLRAVGEQVGRVVERRQAQEALRIAKAEAERANESKSQFLANMSHEIRTPMNAILGFSEILANLVEEGQQKSYLDSIQSSGKTLMGLINDILDLSKVEAGKLELEYAAFNAPSVFREMEQIFSQKVEEKGIDFLIDIDEDLPPALVLDEVRLRQILINLIGNAIKFTDDGHVKVAVHNRYPDEDHSTLELRFSVEDTGIGIPEDQQDKVFGAFEQTAGQSNAQYGGTGLGLAITARLVAMMDGEIWVESEVGKGSTFHVALKEVKVGSIDELADAAEEEDVSGITFEPAVILVVDDVGVNRQVAAAHLEPYGLTMMEAGDGQEAIELSRAHQPDLVLMDMRMPVMNGYDATAAMKGDDELRDIPVVALTALAMREAEEEIRGVCDGYLRKPVSRAALVRELARHLAHTRDNTLATAADSIVETPEVPDVELDAATLAKLPELIGLLRDELQPVWRRLAEKMILTEIEAFAKRARELGDEFGYLPLSQWAVKTSEQASSFQLDALPKTLEGFEGLVADVAVHIDGASSGAR